MPYFAVDRSTWPVVRVKFFDPPTDDEFEDYLSALDALYEEEEPFAIVFDAREAAYLPARYRRRQAEWIRNNEEKIEAYLAGTAYVISSALLRTVLRGIFALQEQPAPYTVTDSIDDAHAWAKQKVADGPDA
jgi:hypothetical protein